MCSCVVPTPNYFYLTIILEWISKYVDYELVKAYDCYIAAFSNDYHNLENLNLSSNLPNVEENVPTELIRPQPAAGPI